MHRDSLLLLLLCALGLSACPSTGSDDDDATDDDDTASDDDDTAAAVTPEAGTWSLTLTELVEDSCDAVPGAGPGDDLGTTQLNLLDGGAGGFVMVDSDDQTFRCTFTTNPEFTCTADPKELPVNQALFPNASAVRDGTRDGRFLSATEAELSSNVNIDSCTGSDCAALGAALGFDYPCTFSFSADAEK